MFLARGLARQAAVCMHLSIVADARALRALLGVYLDPLPIRGISEMPQSAAVSGPPGGLPSP